MMKGRRIIKEIELEEYLVHMVKFLEILRVK
jgi:hypothetical protein